MTEVALEEIDRVDVDVALVAGGSTDLRLCYGGGTKISWFRRWHVEQKGLDILFC